MSKKKHTRKTPRSSSQRTRAPQKQSQQKAISLPELRQIIKKSKSAALTTEEASKLEQVSETLAVMTYELEQKGASVRRLRKLLFGPGTEKLRTIFPEKQSTDASDTQDAHQSDEQSTDTSGTKDAHKSDDQRTNQSDKKDSAASAPSSSSAGGDDDAADASGATDAAEKKPRAKGHGRNGAQAYTGAEKKTIRHDTLRAKDTCPECEQGKLYEQKKPAVMVRVTGMAPLHATVYEMERLRCNLCGTVFTAEAPADVGTKKYDESAIIMIALLKYGCGFPFYRLERLEGDLGIPLPSSTQWDILLDLAIRFGPVYKELIRQAASGDVFYNDDTPMRILNLTSPPLVGKNGEPRKGVSTSGIVSTKAGLKIALFFTGRTHAGENLATVISKRSEELSVPIQMCDGLSVNTPGAFKTVMGNCNAHARRKFVEVADLYKQETLYVLRIFAQVYKNEAETKKQELSPESRLSYHVTHSKPLLDELFQWCEEQFQKKTIEPQSSLGRAFSYMMKRWDKLTLFLRVPGTPLDNNMCERVLKKAILHRKNALFFKTEEGANIGDMFMSFIHTCEFGGINPFDYMMALATHPAQIETHPELWMPWNYKHTLENLAQQNSTE